MLLPAPNTDAGLTPGLFREARCLSAPHLIARPPPLLFWRQPYASLCREMLGIFLPLLEKLHFGSSNLNSRARRTAARKHRLPYQSVRMENWRAVCLRCSNRARTPTSPSSPEALSPLSVGEAGVSLGTC